MQPEQQIEHRTSEIRIQATREEEERQLQLQAELFFTQAQISFEEGVLEVSLAYIEQGLLAVPEHPGLLNLRKQVKARMVEQTRQQLEAARRQEREAERQKDQQIEQARQQAEKAQQQQAEQVKREQAIQTLLKQAEEHFKAKRLTLPSENNAEAAYRQVLKLDKDNVEARAGLERITQQYLQWAQQQRSTGALQESLKQIDRGLKVTPNQVELLRLREEVSTQLAMEQQQEQQRLEQQKQTTNGEAKAAAVQTPPQTFLQAKPKPATAEVNATQHRRCGSILSRLTLGEPVSNEDHLFMTKECR